MGRCASIWMRSAHSSPFALLSVDNIFTLEHGARCMESRGFHQVLHRRKASDRSAQRDTRHTTSSWSPHSVLLLIRTLLFLPALTFLKQGNLEVQCRCANRALMNCAVCARIVDSIKRIGRATITLDRRLVIDPTRPTVE